MQVTSSNGSIITWQLTKKSHAPAIGSKNLRTSLRWSSLRWSNIARFASQVAVGDTQGQTVSRKKRRLLNAAIGTQRNKQEPIPQLHSVADFSWQTISDFTSEKRMCQATTRGTGSPSDDAEGETQSREPKAQEGWEEMPRLA